MRLQQLSSPPRRTPRASNSSKQARFQEALVQFQAAVQEDPGNADSYYNLAAAYHQLGRMENRRDELEQAEAVYNQCLDRDPNHRDCYRGLAVLAAQEGRSSDAIRLLEGWADRQPAAGRSQDRARPA